MPDAPWLQRVIQQAGLLLGRRGRLMAALFGAALAVVLLGIYLAPERHAATWIVAPDSARAWDGPVDRIVEAALSDASLRRVAQESGAAIHPSALERIARAGDLEARLGAAVTPHRNPRGEVEHVRVRVEAHTRAQAVEGARALAERVIAAHAELVRALPGAPAPVDTADVAASARQVADLEEEVAGARAELTRLAERTPGLGDDGLPRLVERLRDALVADEVAIAALEERVDALSEGGRQLELRAHAEARRAYARARAAEAEEQQATARRAAAEEPSRVAELEAELRRLRATRTERHPDVRRLQRLLEAERARAPASDGAPASAAPEGRPATDPADRSEPIRDFDGGAAALASSPIADDDELAVQREGVPPGWLERTPSYEAWISTRAAEEAARRELTVREREQEARGAEHARLSAQLERVRAAEAEAARLEARAEAGEARLRTLLARDVRPEQGPAASRPPAVVQAREADLSVDRLDSAPWTFGGGALGALVLAVLLGCMVDLYDRSFHQSEELAEFVDVPVLGVIPHLKAR